MPRLEPELLLQQELAEPLATDFRPLPYWACSHDLESAESLGFAVVLEAAALQARVQKTSECSEPCKLEPDKPPAADTDSCLDSPVAEALLAVASAVGTQAPDKSAESDKAEPELEASGNSESFGKKELEAVRSLA